MDADDDDDDDDTLHCGKETIWVLITARPTSVSCPTNASQKK